MKTQFFVSIAGIGLISLMLSGCNTDNEKLSGQIAIITETTGTFDPSKEYLITFSDLVGIQDYPNGVRIGVNDSTTLALPRIGEALSIYISDVPANCLNISSSSSTGSWLGSLTTPNDPQHPEAQYGAFYLVPLNGSAGNLTFTIVCN